MQRIRSQNLNYTQVTRVVAPTPRGRPHPFLGIAAQLDGNTASIKPRIVWVEEDNQPQRKEYHVLLLRGDAEVEHQGFKNPEFLFTTYDQNRRTGGVATAWLVSPLPKPEVPPPPERKKPRFDYTTPESRAAMEAAQERERLRKEQDEALNTEHLQQEEEKKEDFLEELFGEDENES